MDKAVPDPCPARWSPTWVVPPRSLSVALVRPTLSATVGVASRTARAVASVDPAAVVATIAALPSLADGVVQVVQRLAVVAERVDGLLDDFERTSGRIDEVVERVDAVPDRIDGITVP